MEPTQLGLILAGSVVALTIGAVAMKSNTSCANDEPYRKGGSRKNKKS